MTSNNSLLLQPDIQTQTQYQLSEHPTKLSIINKLAFQHQEAPKNNSLSFDVSHVIQGIHLQSIFKNVHETSMENTLRKNKVKDSDGQKTDIKEIRRQLAVLSNRYSFLCMENIKLREQSQNKTKKIDHLEKIKASIEEQIKRLIEQNRVLIEQNEVLRNGYYKNSKQNRDLDNLIFHLTEQNAKLKVELKQTCNMLTKKIMTINELQNKLKQLSGKQQKKSCEQSVLFIKDLNRIRSNTVDIFKEWYLDLQKTKPSAIATKTRTSQNVDSNQYKYARKDQFSQR